MSKANNCGTCKHAPDFARTPTGRFKRDTSSRCLFSVALPPLPVSVRAVNIDRIYVAPQDGSNCPTWEAKQ